MNVWLLYHLHTTVQAPISVIAVATTPADPGFDLDTFLEGRNRPPGVLLVLMQRLTQYYDRPYLIETLNKANGSLRQMRSERREACIWVLWGLLLYCELASLRVGKPTREGFVPFPLSVIANWTGLPMRRLERALADLRTAGLIIVSTQKRRQLPDGSYIGYASVRLVAKELFALFGLHNWLKHARRFASGRLHDWATKETVDVEPTGPLPPVRAVPQLPYGTTRHRTADSVSRPLWSGGCQALESHLIRAFPSASRLVDGAVLYGSPPPLKPYLITRAAPAHTAHVCLVISRLQSASAVPHPPIMSSTA